MAKIKEPQDNNEPLNQEPTQEPIKEPTQEIVETKEEKKDVVDEILERSLSKKFEDETLKENKTQDEEQKKEESEPQAKETLQQEPKQKEEEKPEEKTEEELSEREKKLLEQYGLTKFKNVEEAIKSYKELESTYGKTLSLLNAYQKGQLPQDLKEGVEGVINMVKQPRVDVNIPKVEDYVNNEGEIDANSLNSWAKDLITNFTLSLQKSLTFGPLASAIYTLQKSALMERYQQMAQSRQQDEEVEKLHQELLETFPILKTDKSIVNKVSRAIVGEGQLKGQPLTKDEVFKIVAETIGTPPQSKTKQEPLKKVEVVGGKPLITPDKGKPKNELENLVDEIFARSQRKQLF